MTKAGSFLAGFVLAAACAAGAWWAFVLPHERDLETRALDAERATARARRDASDFQQGAEAEIRRRREIEVEAETLKRSLTAAPPARKPTAMNPHAGATPATPPDDLAPEQWDGARLRQEIDMLSASPRGVVDSARYPLVVRSLKTHGDESVALLVEVLASDLEDSMKAVCATLLGAVGDVRGVKPLMALWGTAKDLELRRAVLRGLANIPGDEATPMLVAVWNDPGADASARLLAVHGLARRRHPIALAVAEGGAPGSTPPLRMQTLQTLHAQALQGEWKDTSLVPLFGKALRTADGDAQRKMALLAIEGFWSKDSLADLDAFAESAGTSDLAVRARRAADAIRAGRPRPENAGIPGQRPGVSPVGGEPGGADEPIPPGK
jgi:hypothetical protein